MNALTARLFLKEYPNVTYDQALHLALAKDDLLSIMEPTDWAWQHNVEKRSKAYKICQALAITQGFDRKEHLHEVNVIFSYAKGKVTEERTLWLNRPIKPACLLEKDCRDLIQSELFHKQIHYTAFLDLEVVIV